MSKLLEVSEVLEEIFEDSCAEISQKAKAQLQIVKKTKQIQQMNIQTTMTIVRVRV